MSDEAITIRNPELGTRNSFCHSESRKNIAGKNLLTTERHER